MSVEWILLALSPIFLLLIAIEWKTQPEVYRWQDSLTNTCLALMHQAADALALLLLWPFFNWLHGYALLDIELSVMSLAFAFLLQDFLYYWFHRASHHVRWLWASHAAHHSSRYMNFSTAFRQSLTYPISGMWLFWTPMLLLGFNPSIVFAVVALNLAFQFFVHTQWVTSLGWLEHLFNTPSHHRVHHAYNPEYIDKNFAGVLIIWDKLFGTYVQEQAPCQYGLSYPFNSENPLTVTFYEWGVMWQKVRVANGWRLKLKALFGYPEHD